MSIFGQILDSSFLPCIRQRMDIPGGSILWDSTIKVKAGITLIPAVRASGIRVIPESKNWPHKRTYILKKAELPPLIVGEDYENSIECLNQANSGIRFIPATFSPGIRLIPSFRFWITGNKFLEIG
ncbi:MAG: hypothetical protein Q4G61_10390 [Tissierellia bacterium]|nr:hypothetical protein [Tissierellia bacterium]